MKGQNCTQHSLSTISNILSIEYFFFFFTTLHFEGKDLFTMIIFVRFISQNVYNLIIK